MSIRVDETKSDIEATEPVIPTTCSPEDLPDEELLYDLADLFKVFSDTTRIKILYALMGRELCVADIAEATATSQSAVSHQLRTLKQSHLVKFRRDGRNILYSLADDHVYTMLNQGMSHICEWQPTTVPARPAPKPQKQGKEPTMKKQFKLDEIDCANCARELQDELAKLEGVKSVSVNFMTQKLTLEADDAEFDEVLNRVVEFTADAEPDCEIIL